MDTPTPQTPDHEGRPAPASTPAPVEPLMGLASFVQMAALRPHLEAALKRWMREQRHDPDQYYPQATWQAFSTAMQNHPLP
jgi:hypothetical protein